MRLCTLHNYYALVWLPESDEIMHPAQLLCIPPLDKPLPPRTPSPTLLNDCAVGACVEAKAVLIKSTKVA